MEKVVRGQSGLDNGSFLVVVKKQQSPFMRLVALSKYYYCLFMPYVKANLSAIVFVVTLLVVYYYLTLEADSCIAYAEQIDQSNQVDSSGSSDSSRGRRSHRKMHTQGSLSFSSEVLLVGLSLVFICFILYNYNGGLFFEPDLPPKTPKKK
jgi:hypothetical protein